MKTPAAILVETGRPLELVELEIPALKPGQVLVEIAYSGVCHTQVLEARGHRGADPYLPHCLGHEGSGTVREIGPGVGKAKPGDRVILSWIKGSGADVPGSVYRWGDRPVNAGGITTFSRYAVLSENRLTVMPPDVPMPEAALLGCAVPTGMGAVLNAAEPRPGQSLAVFGAGGVGLCAVAAAALCGCLPVIAVDPLPAKLQVARELGATHAVRAGEGAPAEIRSLSPQGLDFAIEASGRPAAMQMALESVRPRGGTAVIVGNARQGERLPLDPWQLNQGKRLLGTWGGDTLPDRDLPRYCALIQAGRLPLAPFLSRRYPLEAINQALDDLESGVAVRPLITIEPSETAAVERGDPGQIPRSRIQETGGRG
jgi:S-(hydroxymethyl)glutathione dehydrogenase/alcohol dehydrogenase